MVAPFAAFAGDRFRTDRVLAVAMTFTRPAMGALLPAVTRTPADLTAANVSVGVLQHLGVFAGPALAGLLLHGSNGPARVYAAMRIGVALAALAASGGLRLDPSIVTPHEPIAAGDVIHEALEGFRTLGRESDLRVLVILLGLRMMVLGGCGVLFVAVGPRLPCPRGRLPRLQRLPTRGLPGCPKTPATTRSPPCSPRTARSPRRRT